MIRPFTSVAGERRHNLPVQLTSFVGRETEVAEVRRLLGSTRLLTLVGAPGVGKTRLGLQVTAELVDRFEDGAFFVELAPIVDPDLVPSTIAQALGLRDVGRRPVLEMLKEYLANRSLLLVLDNFEQVLSAAATVTGLLGASPGLKVLVTSREPLRLRGEREYAVPPLALPEPGRPPSVAALLQYPAVVLFLERSVAIRPQFTLTTENAPAVAEICVRLDGLPLAIELAAARIRLLSPRAMLARLERRLPLLSGGLRDLPARQQTLRATIAWSYDLLDEAEQRLFRRLSIFVGGCTLEAAEAIGNPDGGRGIDLLDGVTSLVAKSLLRQEEGYEGEPRFGMLETIREYGLEQLAASGEGEAVRSRHAAYVLALVEGAEPELRGRGLGRLVTELANVRAALAWFDEQGREETGLRLAAALHEFWNGRALYAEGRRWLTGLLECNPAAAPELRAKALAAAGHLARAQTDFPAARALLEASIAIRRELGDAPGLAASLYQLSWLAHDLGDFRSQMALMEQRLAVCRELDDRSGIANSLRSQGHALRHLGEYPTARVLLAESIALLRAIGERPSLGWALKFLGEVLVDGGDARQASAPFAEAMRLSRDVGDIDLTWRVLEQIARAALVRGQAGRAARLMGAAEAIRADHEIPLPPVWRKDLYDALLAGVRDALAPAAFAAAWAEGRALPVDRAIEYALAEGATSQCPSTIEQASDGRESSPLTPREREVAALIARGLTNRRIAIELVIGTRTVDAHVYRILRKLGFESRAQIAAWAVEQRLSAPRSD